MKKRISILTVLLLTLTVFLGGCSMFQGKSAYETACDNGFVGTEKEWLNSLKGNDGQDAPEIDIDALFAAYKQENADATFADFLQTLSVETYYDTEYAAGKGIQSAVSVYCTFTKRGTWTNQTEYGSAGSGVAYRIEAGTVYIIINYHVVYDSESTTANGLAKTINVYSYGYEYSDKAVQAEFVGGSITKDIAVIKADVLDFSGTIRAAELADSNQVALGERVVAVGNPSAEGLSVSAGVLSVDSEEIEMEALDSASKTIFLRVLRTDTAINSGNSGGGLYNSRGKLLGIVNAKAVETGVENIGFAIPVNVAAGIADCVIDNASKKCVLGVTVRASTSSTYYNSAQNRVEITESLTVDTVSIGTPSDGKLQSGDVLLSARINDGETFYLSRVFHLSDYLYKMRVGDTIYLEVERGNDTVTIQITPASSAFSAI